MMYLTTYIMSISFFSSDFCNPTNKHNPLEIELTSCPSTKKKSIEMLN